MFDIELFKDVLSEKDLKELNLFLDLIKKDLQPDKIREEVKQLVENVGSSYFKLAAYLYLIAKNQWYLRWGYNSLKEYVEKELSFRLRKAQYLISIWHWYFVEVRDLEVVKKVLPLGWSKMAALVGVVDRKNVDEWVEKAKKLDVVGLQEEIRAQKLKVPPRKLVRKSFLLDDNDAEVLINALEVIKKENQGISESKALGLICLHFLGSYVAADEDWLLRTILPSWEKRGYKFIVRKKDKDGEREVYKSL